MRQHNPKWPPNTSPPHPPTPKNLEKPMVFEGFLHFPDSCKMLPQIGKMSQDGPPNAAMLAILGAKLANIAPSWRQLRPHVRPSRPLWSLLGHLGCILASSWAPFSSQSPSQTPRMLSRTPKPALQHRFFKDWSINFGPISSMPSIFCVCFLC